MSKATICLTAMMLSLVAMPASADAQGTTSDCFSIDDNRLARVSGRIIHVRLDHPLGNYSIEGYGLALVEPLCFITRAPQSGAEIRLYANDVGLMPIFSSHSEEARNLFWDHGRNRHRWDEMDQFIKANVGNYITVLGTVENDTSPDQLLEPQIAVGWYAKCDIGVSSTGADKC